MSHTLTWLHLSDLHARIRNDWDARKITASLVCDLKAMQQEHGLHPDFIFITGDVAFGATEGESMVDQYQLARNFFDDVCKAFNPEVPTRNIYVVPGNHDVDRNEITPDQTAWLRQTDRNLHEIQNAQQAGQKQWRTWMDRLINYRNFLTSYNLLHLKPDDPHLIWGDSREIHGFRVGIAGLNTAWSCADDKDKANLWFGYDWQIAKAIDSMGPVDFAICLLHHPGNWFTSYEDPAAMRRLRQEFTIVLHGHEHQEWVESDSEDRLVLSAGACYESSWMPNGYSFGQIDLNSQQGSIHLRQYSSSSHGWVPFNVAGKTNAGIWPIQSLPWVKKTENMPDNNEPPKTNTCTPQPILEDSTKAHYTKRYCQYIIDQHDVLELFGCDIPRELQRHQLSVAYVSLNLAHEILDDNLNHPLSGCSSDKSKTQDGSGPGKVKSASIDNSSVAIEFVLDEISAATGRLLINGPAGAGKSTLMRWCAIHAAQHVFNRVSGADPASPALDDPACLPKKDRGLAENLVSNSGTWINKVPFLIRLRDCPTGRLPAANDLPGFLAKHLPTAPPNWMTDILYAGQALILFDGVDEIHRDQRSQLAEDIGELIRTYPKCIYVVTTRPGAVEKGWLSRLDFSEARIEPMSRRDREEFIDKWYRSATLELQQRPRAGEDLNLTAKRLKAELAEQPELGVLTTNPLLCAMVCALYRERREKLPETPAELSEALCHMLLHRRERETPGLADNHFLSSWRGLHYPQKKGLLSELAWHMVSQGDSSLEAKTALDLVESGLNAIPGRSKNEAADVVQALVERSGLIRPASEERIDFIHNTLKEFLAAGRVVEEGCWEPLAQNADDPAWQPVILFALALAPEPFSSGLICELLERATSTKKPSKKAGNLRKKERQALAIAKAQQFFLVRCRAATKWLSADLSITIDGFLKHLLPPSSMNEVDALSQLGPRILSCGATTLENPIWWSRQTCHMVVRCLRLLRLVGGPRAKAILKSVKRIPSYSTQVNNEWLLACGELCPDERLPWPFQKLEKVKHLTLSSSAISDISRLDDLTSLQTLNLNRTAVRDLSPLSALTSIQEIDVSETQVVDLGPLAGLVSLKAFTCEKTMVGSLAPLAGLSSLESLEFSKTQVIDLSPLASLGSLKHISCCHTKVEDLSPLSRLRSLKSIFCGRAPVRDLAPLASIASLRGLALFGTEVIDLYPLAGLHSLTFLDLERTQVVDIRPLAGLESINTLYLENTAVFDITALSSLKSLQRLDLGGTQISDVSPLTELTPLIYLNLAKTEVEDIRPLTGLVSLRHLILSETQITDLSPIFELSALTYLDISSTQISDISSLIELKSLKFLVLSSDLINEDELDVFRATRPDIGIRYKAGWQMMGYF